MTKEAKRITGMNWFVTFTWLIMLLLFLPLGACKKIQSTPVNISMILAEIPSSCNSLVKIGDGKIILYPYSTAIETVGPSWVNYVKEHVDILRYYKCSTLDNNSDGQSTVGLSTFESNLRVADIALEKRTAIVTAATIIHEAAHLSGIKLNNGHFFDEKYARRIEKNFWTDFFNAWHDGHYYDPRFRELFVTVLYGLR